MDDIKTGEKKPCIPPTYARIFMDFCHEVQREKKLTNETIRRAIDIPKTTHRRIWKNDDPQMHMDLDVAVHASIFLDISLDEVLLSKSAATPPSPVMENVVDMLVERKDTINDLTAELDGLRQKLTASAEEVDRLTAELHSKNEEITRIQSDYIDYIKRMTAELNTCHQQMHEIERYYADRIAELQDELNRRK